MTLGIKIALSLFVLSAGGFLYGVLEDKVWLVRVSFAALLASFLMMIWWE